MTETASCSLIEKKVNGTVVRLQEGDLTALPADAMVFYAREDLQLGSGYGTAIQARGGSAVKTELEAMGRIQMGEAVVTGGGGLQATHIIHVCGPKFQEAETEQKLRQAMHSMLVIARERQFRTITVPPLGTGFYGVPPDLSARVMTEVIAESAKTKTTLETITICVNNGRDFAAFQKRLEAW